MQVNTTITMRISASCTQPHQGNKGYETSCLPGLAILTVHEKICLRLPVAGSARRVASL